jgi:2-amino-4-hydroxy-6-hydroxymethyldihydropteridine diphosphokinase
MPLVILGLGSNVGERDRYLAEAIREIAAHVDALEYSRVYVSQAVLPPGAAPEWDMPFLNMALRGQTELSPEALLSLLQSIEEKLGRKARGHWGPREIDLDILACEDSVIDTPELRVPHPFLLERNFALRPLADIAPGWRYPAPGQYQGKTALELVQILGLDVGEGFSVAQITLPMLR